MFDVWSVTAAYAFSLIGGGLLAKGWISVLRKAISAKFKDVPDHPKDPSVQILDWTIGIFERGTATTLAIWTPALLPPFVGGWVALKFAANWQVRKQGNEDLLAKHRLVALIGSAISFATAIAMGLLVHPESASIWAPTSN